LVEAIAKLSLSEIAAKVDFSTEQVAKMCGVSRRQLAYWGQKGIIPADGYYSLATVEKVVLIRKALNRGSTLRQAVAQVETRLGRRAEAAAELAGLNSSDVDALCASRLERVEQLLKGLNERMDRAPAQARQQAMAKVKSLHIEEMFGANTNPMTPRELGLCLTWLIEQLEAVDAELPGEMVER
jgi:DNA-binding transcriptional MerR regulator